MTARLNPAHNPRRFPPCLPPSPSERPSSSSPSSASESSSKPEQTAAALAEAASYRRSVFPPTGAQRTAIRLADAFTDQQKLIDVLLAEWKASNEYARESTLHGKAKAWRVRVDASVAVDPGGRRVPDGGAGMRYTISESWGTDPANPSVEFGLYIVHSDDPDGIEKTFRWYADAQRYRDALNEVTSTEPAVDETDDPDGHLDLLVDARLGVR